MASDIQIRVVNVEFLRAGPPHNQLLSPLTQYLAVCNNSSAGVVTLPYEQARFERKLSELRYGGGGGEDLRSVLHEVGEEVAKVLGAVPGLPGALSLDPGQAGPGTMIHLRLTLSASELAMLPFELSKVPISATQAADAWLGVQTRPPVTITRNVRSLSPEAVAWPTRPRVLFISAGRDDVPFEPHRDALRRAVEPFRHPRNDPDWSDPDARREGVGRLLTILSDPTLNDIRLECQREREAPYTHVHILAHGVRDGHEYGLSLRGSGDASDVVPGERLANALTLVDERGVHRPAVVTLASCDSASVGSLMVPSTHLAHALHQAGVPLVVASQFPLSKEGSEPLAESLCAGLLSGQHPLVLLQQLRAELHARYTASSHDWASLVVYEALPRAIGERLVELRYRQARRAVEAVLGKVDRAVDDGSSQELGGALRRQLEAALRRLPFHGPFDVECLGLRASARKRLAEAVHRSVLRGGDDDDDKAPDLDPYELLEEARSDYELAARKLLMNDVGAVQRSASLHWVLVQACSLAIVLGKHKSERSEGAWETARLAADFYTDHNDPEERAWAHASLAELWLCRLADARLSDKERREFGLEALDHTRALLRLFPSRSAFPIVSTRRQVERYLSWWGTPEFESALRSARGAVRVQWDTVPGLLETAREIRAMLRGPSRGASDAAAPASSEPPAGTGKREPSPQPSAPDAGAPAAIRSAAPPSAPRDVAAPPVEGTLGARRRKPGSEDAFLRIEMLPAGHGDCLWIEYGARGKPHRVLIDCGTQATAKTLLERVDKVPEDERALELFVMTHVDADHIGGALPFFKAVKRGLAIADVWFNGWEQISGMLGAKQGEMFTTAIKDFHLPLNQWRRGGAIAVGDDRLPRHELPGGLALTLLSPTPAQLRKMAPVWVRELKKNGLEPGSRVEYDKFLGRTRLTTSTDVDELADARFDSDTAPANGTSIALLAEYAGASLLLGADAHAPVMVDSIRRLLAERGAARLEVSAFKLPHHGSRNNLSRQLMELVACPRYLFSSNGDHFLHPDREAVARAVKYGGPRPALFFNYSTKFNEVWARPDLQEKHGYSAVYPGGGQAGLTLDLLGP